MRDLEDDNAKLKEALAARERELKEVREQLASLNRGAGGEECAVRASESAVHEGAFLLGHVSPLHCLLL